MSDELQRMVGQIDGKLDSLTTLVRDHIDAHNARHRVIDQQVQGLQADINQAKGAKAVLLLVAGAIAGTVAFVVDLIKRG